MNKIVIPENFTRGNIYMWREQEKARRKGICEMCGRANATDLHECIVTRRDAQGLPWERRKLIFANCNMILVCRACHREIHGTRNARTLWWTKMCGIYGFAEMVRWYEGFEWKVPDRRFMRNE